MSAVLHANLTEWWDDLLHHYPRRALSHIGTRVHEIRRKTWKELSEIQQKH